MLRTIFAFNVAKWKRPLIKKYFTGDTIIFLPLAEKLYDHRKKILFAPRKTFLVWGTKQPKDLNRFANEFNIPIWRVEDGFIRSIGLGSEKSLPYSLCIDKRGIYFDSSNESDLEVLLNNYDFSSEPDLMNTAHWCIGEIREHGLSKYNESQSTILSSIYGPHTRPRILVLGQVEDDQSILHGSNQVLTNADLIQTAINENPEGQIIYKPHPDYLSSNRKAISNFDKIKGEFLTIPVGASLKDALFQVDRVYTLTSLGGFEALVHDVPVTCLGAPFYAGWGITDDRLDLPRRRRKLTVEEIFAVSYIKYPTYIHPITYRRTNIKNVFNEIIEQLNEQAELGDLDYFHESYFYNLATKTDLDPVYFLKNKARHVVIITDNDDSIRLARAIAQSGKKVTLLTALDTTARSPRFSLSAQEMESIQVSSFSKLYGNPMSVIEKQSVNLSKMLARAFRNVLIKQEIGWCADAVEAFTLDFEDYIYQESLRFISAEYIVKDFDGVILAIANPDARHDIFYSIKYHANMLNELGKISVYHRDRIGYGEIERLFSINNSPEDLTEDLPQLVRGVYWKTRHSIREKLKSTINAVAVIGNLSNENYAYSPSALRVIKNIQHKNNILFLHPNLGAEATHEEIKDILLKYRVDNFIHYDASAKRFSDAYPEILESKEILYGKFSRALVEEITEVLSRTVVHAFEGRISNYARMFIYKLIYATELEYLAEQIAMVYTTQDRSLCSTLLTAFCARFEKKTIGVQPQIISVSPRYRSPKLTAMGVIDSSQKEIYSSFGLEAADLQIIGSVNIAERLESIRNHRISHSAPDDKMKTILFAMQHSTEEGMLAIAENLKKCAQEHSFKLYIKPHPHQEQAVLNRIQTLFAETPNCRILSPTADTYTYLAQADLVVGLFSSVLYEAALSGKKVLIGAFHDLHESIDFSVKKIAMKAQTPDDFRNIIAAVVRDNDLFSEIERGINDYLKLNPQFSEADTYKYFDDFVIKNLH